MSAEVKVEPINLSFRVVVSERPANAMLYQEFKSALEASKKIEATWDLSDEVISFATRPHGKDIVYGNGGFVVSNIAPDDVVHFKELISGLCKKLNLRFLPEIKKSDGKNE